jgi:hypothetical protein
LKINRILKTYNQNCFIKSASGGLAGSPELAEEAVPLLPHDAIGGERGSGIPPRSCRNRQVHRAFQVCQSGANVMLLKIVSPKQLGILKQITSKYSRKFFMAMLFKNNAVFCRKLAKIAENSGLNITPRLEKIFQSFFEVGPNCDATSVIVKIPIINKPGKLQVHVCWAQYWV